MLALPTTTLPLQFVSAKSAAGSSAKVTVVEAPGASEAMLVAPTTERNGAWLARGSCTVIAPVGPRP